MPSENDAAIPLDTLVRLTMDRIPLNTNLIGLLKGGNTPRET